MADVIVSTVKSKYDQNPTPDWFDVIVFDGTQCSAVDNGDGFFTVTVDSPSGEKVQCNARVGDMFLSRKGVMTLVAPHILESQFEEVIRG